MVTRVGILLSVVSLFALAAHADPIDGCQGVPPTPHELAARRVPVDGSWTVLDELMTEGAFFAPIYTYTSPDPIQIDVTDLFVVSDQIEVYLDTVLLGTTPAMPDWANALSGGRAARSAVHERSGGRVGHAGVQ